MVALYNASIQDLFSHLNKIMKSERFLSLKGLNNEIPFFIFPFKPENQLEITKMSANLYSQLREKGLRVLEINLYDLALDMLNRRNIWEIIVENESVLSKTDIIESIEGPLDPTHHIAPEIASLLESSDPIDIIWVTGIGEVYPFMRVHTLLNALQKIIKLQPTVFFFPGNYKVSKDEGNHLQLFNRLPAVNYYRAFNILEYQA